MPVSRLIAEVLVVTAISLYAGVAFSADNQTKARSQDIQLSQMLLNSRGGQIPPAAKPRLRKAPVLGRHFSIQSQDAHIAGPAVFSSRPAI
jgi:hypothetical protein